MARNVIDATFFLFSFFWGGGGGGVKDCFHNRLHYSKGRCALNPNVTLA